MATNKKHCLLFLVLFLILILGISMVSATTLKETTKNTSEIKKLSTPSNNDVDKKVQSGVQSSTSDAYVKIAKTKDNNTTKNTENTITTLNNNKSKNTVNSKANNQKTSKNKYQTTY